MNIKEKTISGLLWSFIDNIASQGIIFIVGVVLARLLSPKEFGLIGMITIFVSISQIFVNSGFGQSLIRKQNASQTDYSTIFYFNLFVGVLFYVIIFFSAKYIAIFFKEPQLVSLLKVLGIGIIVNSLGVIQTTILTKNINFKLQAKISVISAIISGIIGISLAYYGFGVWSLVWRTLAGYIITTIFLWLFNTWKPDFIFSKESLKELFGFGNKLMISQLIDSIYTNIYYLIIGKYYNAFELGYYTRAEQFKNLPSQNLNGIISKVSFPVLSSIQDDKVRLKNNYKQLIRSTMFITFTLMLGLAATAEPLVITLIGEQWRPSIIYLQMLSIVGMFYPLHALNLNMLQVQGRSDLYLRLEIIKKTLAIPTIIIGIIWGIKIMIVGMLVNTIIAYYLNSYWSGRFINYPIKEQIKDILPSFILALSINLTVFFIGYFLQLHSSIVLIIQMICAILIFIIVCESIKFRDYLILKELIFEKIEGLKKK
jgi:teichuronic acid exporter